MERGDRITPETKVGALLDTYPELEATLVEISPRFEKLKNPLLRRTLAKVATLAQAAAIGNVSVPTLVATLRAAAGQDEGPADAAAAATASDGVIGGAMPAWVTNAAIADTIDADAMLAQGVHPLGLVRQKAAALAPGEVLRLDVAFRPAPLIETLLAAGHPVWCDEDDAGRFHAYVGAAD